MKIIRSFSAHWIDFDKEAEIGIGIKWPTDIAPDECVISSHYHTEDPHINKGDTAVVASSYRDLFWTVATKYNTERGEKAAIDPNIFNELTDATVLRCTVKFFANGGNGKLPQGLENAVFLSDVENYLPRLFNNS